MRHSTRGLVLLALALSLVPTAGCTNGFVLGANPSGAIQTDRSTLKVNFGGDLLPLISTQATADQIDHLDVSVKIDSFVVKTVSVARADLAGGATLADLPTGYASVTVIVYDAEGYVLGETKTNVQLEAGKTHGVVMGVTLIPDLSYPTASPSTLITNFSITNGSSLTSGITVSTVAGNGTQGHTDGTGTAATFKYPTGLAMLPSGDLLVGDSDSYLRRVSPTGVVSQVTLPAGATSPGNLSAVAVDPVNQRIYYQGNGARPIASMDFAGGNLKTFPVSSYTEGLAVDRKGNLYVSERNYHRIRKFAPDGTEDLTFVGKNPGGYFNYPEGLAFDPAGNLLVADRGNNRIVKITPAGSMSVLAGSGKAGYVDGTGANAEFDHPTSVASDLAGNLYVTDEYNHRVRKITRHGVVTTVAGQLTSGMQEGVGTDARFYYPKAIAVAPDGAIYVADNYNHRLRVIK